MSRINSVHEFKIVLLARLAARKATVADMVCGTIPGDLATHAGKIGLIGSYQEIKELEDLVKELTGEGDEDE